MSKRALLVAVAVAAAAFVAAAQAADPPPKSFTDASGDGGTAADIADVDVSNTAAGQYTFRVGLNTAYAADGQFWLYLDTDKSASTGSSSGADYLIYEDETERTFYFLAWNGSEWADTSGNTASFAVSADARQVTVSVNRSDLRDTAAFDFFVVTADADGSDGHFDDAPSGSGTWSYAFQQPLTLTAGAAKSAVVRAQHAWVVATAVTRSDTGETVGADATLACSATAAGAKLKTLEHAFVSAGAGKGSAAVCAFALPKKKNVLLQAKITVGYGGVSVTRTVTARS